MPQVRHSGASAVRPCWNSISSAVECGPLSRAGLAGTAPRAAGACAVAAVGAGGAAGDCGAERGC